MENYLSEKEADKQESLNEKRLEIITKPILSSLKKFKERPSSSLIELFNWAYHIIHEYDSKINDNNVLKVNNSKVSIDGSFIQFCEENKVKIECLLSDVLSSWKTEMDSEHFLTSGIFKITVNNWYFYHCALFHKGSKNEDEVSFFIILDRKVFEKYVIFRNEYSEWLKQRNKDIAEIEVMGGESILYTRDLTWDSICLEEEIKQNIQTSVQGFLQSKELFNKLKVPWKYGLVFWGERGCGKTLCIKVLMSVYKEFKPVTIHPGHPESDELLEEAFAFAQENAPALLFFEDFQEMLNEVSTRHFLQLLDGVQGRDGIFIVATGNDLKSLEDNITNRPRRFDKKIEFPLPSQKMTVQYLNKWFNEILSTNEINSIAKKAVKNKMTYSHLQDIYFNSVFLAVGDGRETPNKSDIDKACEDVIKGKKVADDGFVSQGIVARRSITDYEDKEYEI